MYSFEGEFRRKPIQSLGGATKHQQRDILLQRAQSERQKREELRKQNQCAITIQAFVRGCMVRVIQKKYQRQEFERLQNLWNQNVSATQLQTLISKLQFFYHEIVDANKLVWIAVQLIKLQGIVIKECQSDKSFLFGLSQFLNLTLRRLACAGSTALKERDSFGSFWRVLELYLTMQNWDGAIGTDVSRHVMGFMYRVLIKKGYFVYLRKIADEKIPPLVEATVKPPTPLSACILHFIIQPLQFVTTDNNTELRTSTVKEFCANFLELPYSEGISNFILPSLAQKKADVPLLKVLQIIENNGKNPWLFHSLLLLADGHPSLNDQETIQMYIKLLGYLTECLQYMKCTAVVEEDGESEEEEDFENPMYKFPEQEIMQRCVEILNGVNTVHTLVAALQLPEVLHCICNIGHNLLLSDKLALHKYRLLYTLAFKPSFLRQLYLHIKNEKQVSIFVSSDTPLIKLLANGVSLSSQDIQRIVPVLDVFCSLFSHLLVTLDDSEFYNESGSASAAMPFTLSEVRELASILRDVCLGLVELAYPDTRTVPNFILPKTNPAGDSKETRLWLHLFKSTVNLVRQLHTRDTRRAFCSSSLWITGRVTLPLERNSQFAIQRQPRTHRPFRSIRPLSRIESEQEGNTLMSTRDIRTLTILREVPFVFSFTDRVKMWQQWIHADKLQQQSEANFLRGPSIQIMIRRNYIYEDAFEKLSVENEPNLRLKMRVQLTNTIGLDEAGIDGGGIFREFLSELLKTCFDPNRGFFRLTRDNLLYPNPGVSFLIPDFPKHYFFIGRMLGKALYENLLVELPLADFFLSKILGQASASLDVHHLASLDPVLHKNLLYLRHYDGDVSDLGLDFTIVSSELGETKVEELKTNGANIPVTSLNRIEYIHLIADYKLNKQIRLQCNAFRQGLADVINLEWLQTFSYRELQVLISGAYTPVDLEDLRQHTHYSGGYSSSHPVIQNFWKVVSQFDDKQKRHLLKFVTSCSRPPLLGFKELDPPFCIQNAGTEDRLPTASTCMNLLKLPEFPDERTLRDKLLYALESGAGFELS